MTENIPNKRSNIQPISEVPTYPISPLFKKYRTRTIIIYAILCLIGILPYLLNEFDIVAFAPSVQAIGWGLFLPGGALIAAGTIWSILLGGLLFVFFYKFGLQVMASTGIVVLNIYLWLLSVVGGAFSAKADTPWYAIVIIVLLIAVTIYNKTKYARKNQRIRMEQREAHEQYLYDEMITLENEVCSAEPSDKRELDADAVKASRYLFEMTLREPGDFTGYQSVEQSQMSSFRYSLDYLGYSLALMQCHYTPNFHGYLNKAQRFVIESFTHPSVCSYWKWSYLGGMLRWNPDPIGNLNIMLTGWSGIPVSLYGANTGDLRYEEPGALRFRPSGKSEKTYNYSSRDIVEVLVRQFKDYKTKLYPCEPHWVFPLCNTMGFNAVLAYDRHHGTHYLESVYDELDKSLQANFMEVSGYIGAVRNTLVGFRSLELMPAENDGLCAFILARYLNPVNPGLAKRSYLFGRKDYTSYTDGELITSMGDWSNMLDMGNFKKSPGYTLAAIGTAACEMGDTRLVKSVFDIAEKYMGRVDNTDILEYKTASVSSNANLASMRFAQKDDWYNMMHKGPGSGALKGPILAGCQYPNVLVARAMSNGEDLDLVLYNGCSKGKEKIEIERLKPAHVYKVKNTGISFTADREGKAALEVNLDGRTEVHIIPS